MFRHFVCPRIHFLMRLALLPALALLAGRTAQAQTPVGAAFTYQGILAQSGSPVDGVYQMKFDLYGAASGGSALAPQVSLTAVTVTKGRFTVDLDFGASVFVNDARWLEVAVRPGASGSFTTLGRQRLRPAPFAIRAQSAETAQTAQSVPWSALTGVPASLANGDDNTTYSAGVGLQLLGTQFNVLYAGSGSAATAARSDHNHDATYLTPAGGDARYLTPAGGDARYLTPAGGDARYLTPNGPALITSSSTLPTLDIVQLGTPLRPTGLRGQAGTNQVNTAGLLGIAVSASNMAALSYFPAAGVRGESTIGWGVMGVSDTYWGLFGYSRDNHGIYGQSNSFGPNIYGGYFTGPSGVYGIANLSNNYGGTFKGLGSGLGRALLAAGSTTITQNLNVGGTLNVTNVNSSTNAIHATSPQVTANAAAILGVAGAPSTDANAWTWAGLRGESQTGNGIIGTSDNSVGVIGSSKNSIGAYGLSANDNGVYGVSNASSGNRYGGFFSGPSGIFGIGTSTDGYGGYFASNNGRTLYAAGSATVTQTLNAGKVAYITPRQHYFSLPGNAFRPYYSDTVVQNYSVYQGTYVTGGSNLIVAPLNLPDGAIIKTLKGNFYNNGIASSVLLTIYRVTMASGALTTVATFTSTTNTGNFASSANPTIDAYAIVDNANYSYFLGMSAYPWSGTNVRFIGAQVIYTIGEAE